MKDIKLEADVVSSNGNKVGTVDRVIVHPETLEIEGIIVSEGFLFNTDRIVKEEMIDRVDADGNVVLSITDEDEERLPELASARFVGANDQMLGRLSEMHHMATPAATGQVLVFSERVDPEYAPAPDSPLQPAPTNPPNIVDRDNLPEGTVTLEEGTDVIDIEGEKIGEIDDVIYDADDQITEIVVGSGIIFTHQVRIPAAWIESVTSDTVVISRTAEQAEEAGRID